MIKRYITLWWIVFLFACFMLVIFHEQSNINTYQNNARRLIRNA